MVKNKSGKRRSAVTGVGGLAGKDAVFASFRKVRNDPNSWRLELDENKSGKRRSAATGV
ncbi:hypothetical protein [Sporosarcina sp.]|uniref:hypothetical protein n=1 Tax=Sporosarcina sp. TaxID=49982 RepID=UPI002635E94C|nr:hypothetical protein [Sporosarcina sp.]